MLEGFWIWLAWKLPRPLAYWCAMRVCSFATVGRWDGEDVAGLTAVDALRRWPAR